MYLITGGLIFILGVVCYLVGRVLLLGIRYKNHRPIDWLKEIIRFLFVIYICKVVSVTLFPLPVGFNSGIENITRSINLMPFKSIIENISHIGVAYDGDVQFMIGLILRNVGGNLLLLLPLGFLVPLLWLTFRHFKKMVLLGLTVSICIELLQLIETWAGGWSRITDIDDIILNVLGVMLGYLFYQIVFKMMRRNLAGNRHFQKWRSKNEKTGDYYGR
ncbi:MAG TPA: VanZ family protein [Bacillales bacterium]|nr:VanZ family protein [Bacillales bacterium]